MGGQQLAQKDASASSPVVLLPFGNPVSRLLQARTLSCLRNHKVVGGKKKKTLAFVSWPTTEELSDLGSESVLARSGVRRVGQCQLPRKGPHA